MGEGDVEERECREERVIFREIGFNVLLGVCRLFLKWMLARVRKGGGGVTSTTRREMDSVGGQMEIVSGRDMRCEHRQGHMEAWNRVWWRCGPSLM